MDDFYQKVLKHAKPENIECIDGDGNGIILENGVVFVSGQGETGIRCLLHELCHMHPKFIEYTKRLWNGGRIDESTERRIEEYAQEVYRAKPDIIAILRQRIGKAIELSRDREDRVKRTRKNL